MKKAEMIKALKAKGIDVPKGAEVGFILGLYNTHIVGTAKTEEKPEATADVKTEEPKADVKTEEPKAVELKQEEPKDEFNPEDWASAIVPSGSQKGKKLAAIGKPALTKLYEYYLEKGFTTPFSKCVEKAAEDLHLDAPTEEVDDIPY